MQVLISTINVPVKLEIKLADENFEYRLEYLVLSDSLPFSHLIYL